MMGIVRGMSEDDRATVIGFSTPCDAVDQIDA
jgi:hypothetical protein